VRAHPGDEPELVLIDTDGLGDLARVQEAGDRGPWWLAGPLLSRGLVEAHRDRGEAAGVVAPGRAQARVTLDALRDVEPGEPPLAGVGTAHWFRDREFPVVVFDPVVSEFGRAPRTAPASWPPGGDEAEQAGGQAFNVAATCAAGRLYVIASRQRVMDARPGTALGHLGALVRDGRVTSLRAMSLVTPPAWEPVSLGPEGTALAQALARHTEVTDVNDEKSFYEHLAALIDQAAQTIRIWSPWAANRVYRLLPRLQDAARRGVKITVFTRDPGDRSQGTEVSVTALNALGAIAQVVEMNVARQKLVVVDDHTVMTGSLSALSRHGTREVMITTRGRHLARRLLAEFHAEAFASPPACAACGEHQVDLRRGENGYYWRCRSRTCPAYGQGSYKAWTQQVDLTSGRG
jgi:phosphatidylserine/phosphatidylglycerophosphate/cardiolipin synthase-like enzyme